jgi:hypothetical protein
MRYLSVFRPIVLAASALLVMSGCGCDTKREERASKDFVEVVTTSSPGSSSRTNGQEILLGAENNVCAIYPEDIPELFADKTVPHKVYWRALGQHSFTITFRSWPFSGTSGPIAVPKGGSSNVYYVSSTFAGGDVPYTTTYDNNLPCNYYIPGQGAMGVHITK